MTRVYYKYAIAAVIVFDLSRPATFDAVTKWREDINSKVVLANNEPIPCLLLANKCDIPGVTIDHQGLDDFVKKHGFIGWFPTSAQEDVNIDEAMMALIKEILKVSQANAPPPQKDSLSLDGGGGQQQQQQEGGNDGCCS
eukprot:TRINITY_DN174_c0_g2_i3.p2 TRINITY_DN174_c0_g2~~TRINITY_DN174_c0_g2_i3.p2  ORF type:complete len:140 (+),score=40.20 TRINITY_DN174_c0_g2_i3:351-770(+)